MTSVTIATLRAEIYELLDITSTSTTSDAQVNRLIKRKLSRVRNALIGINESYFTTTVSMTLATSKSSIDLSHTSVIAASVQVGRIVKILYVSGDYTYELPEMKSEDYVMEVYNTSAVDPQSLKWLLRGDKLVFNGSPNASCTLYLWYVPIFNDAMTSTAAIAWKTPFNWTDPVVYGVCADLRERSEEDPRYFDGKYQQAMQDIFDEAQNRSLVSDGTVWDAYNRWG